MENWTRGVARAARRGVLVLAWLVASCAPDPLVTSRCTPGAQTACACVGGAQGAQVCGASGTFGACLCPDASTTDGTDVPSADTPTQDAPAVDVPSIDAAPIDASTADAALPDVVREDAALPDAPSIDLPAPDVPSPTADVVDATTDVRPAVDAPVDVPVDTGCSVASDPDDDDDGLTDAEELAAGTDPCVPDSDGDGATDLVEVAAMTDGRSAASRPPDASLYVVLPYRASAHATRALAFATRIRAADVFFLVDNSASMTPIISALRTNLGTIVAGVRAQVPDLRVGVASFDSMPFAPAGAPGSPGDYTLWMRQSLTADVPSVQSAFDAMRTIDDDTRGNFLGGDAPEDQTEALYEVVAGGGSRDHVDDAASLRSVRNALDPMGNGWVPRVDPARDCGATPSTPRYGWGCFGEGRVPIVVLASDAQWYDGCYADDATRFNSAGRGHNCDQVVAAFTERGGFFVGVDVGLGVGGFTYNNARLLAMRTGTVDAAGAPIVFGPGRTLTTVSSQIVDAVARLAGGTRQDVTARAVADPTATGLPAGRTTADFVRALVPLRATPEMPDGYTRRDATTFYGVSPSAQVVFEVDLFNDFMEGGSAARTFVATVEAIGRGRTVLDARTITIVVPARGAGPSS